ncbi:MAG: hypothetical protein HZB56_16035 [Deltaproteobacteria bacterium]|nr:hypothetical protein [Deltaproteobacteria bacterium]
MRPRTAVGLAALLALAAALASVAAGRARLPPEARVPSVELTGARGAAALHDWLAATGRAPLRVSGPDELPAGAVAVLAAPVTPLSAAEVERLLARTAAGGLLVYAAGAPGAQPLLDQRLQVSRPRLAGAGERAVPLAAHPLFDGLSLAGGGGSVASGLPGALPVAGGPGFTAAVSAPLGRGEVLLLAGPDLLENPRLAEADNLLFWARVAERGRLAFDEGHFAAARSPAPAAGRLTPLLLQLLAAAALLLWSLARRLGPIRPPPAQAARTAADYLASLGALYRSARAEPELAAAAWRAHRLRLQRQVGIAAALPDGQAAERLATLRPEAAPAFREAAARAARGPRDPAALARLVAGVARVEALLARRALAR